MPWLAAVATAIAIGFFAPELHPLIRPLAPEDTAASPQIAGKAMVIDGDTIEINRIRIRLHGIDAPESSQTCAVNGEPAPCGRQAARALADKIGARPVRCIRRDTDAYGRAVAVCHADGRDLNAWMVAEGWALAFRRYSTDYVAQEEAARAAKRGVWRGAIEAPWDFRRNDPASGRAVRSPA